MLPLLIVAGDGREHTVRGVLAAMAEHFHLTSEQRAIRVPSGQQSLLHNRVSWASTYLAKSRLIARPARGRFVITDRGRQVLSTSPSRIDRALLRQFEEYREFTAVPRVQAVDADEDAPPLADSTALERLNEAAAELREAVIDEIAEGVRSLSPSGFERLVVRLLTGMGYGGGSAEFARVTGRSGDGGIDGEIREDRLGLDTVYLQAKKWENTVGPADIDRFVGSLSRRRAQKGVFITSSTFTDGARRAAAEASMIIRLIDGDELASLMFDHDVGVSHELTVITKRIDSDFFDDLGSL
jgi:restriction system protein